MWIYSEQLAASGYQARGDRMIKLSMPQMYLIGFIQRSEYTLHINRPARVGCLRPVEGNRANPIYITLAQADAMVKRNAVAPMELHPAAREMNVEVYQDNWDFERVPYIMKSRDKGSKHCSYYRARRENSVLIPDK